MELYSARVNPAKIFLAFSALTCSFMTLPAFADSVFDGFYAGGGLGESETQASISSANVYGSQLFNSIPSVTQTDTFSNAFSTLAQEQSILGAFHLGYGSSVRGVPLYFALEAFISGAERKPSVTTNSGITYPSSVANTKFLSNMMTTAKLQGFEYGADFKPAVLLTPYTLLYGRVGIAFNQATLTNQDLVGATSGAAVASSNTATATGQKNMTGARLGFGLERYIMQRLSVSFDYIYTKYGSINIAGATTLSTPYASGTFKTSTANRSTADLTSQSMLVGVNYYFSGDSVNEFDNVMVDRSTAALQVNGFYAGIRAGYSGTTSNTKVQAAAVIPTSVTNSPNSLLAMSQNNSLWKNSATGAAFLGFGGLVGTSSFYLSGEFFADTSGNSNMVSNSAVSDTTTTTSSFSATNGLATQTTVDLKSPVYGFDLRPGVMISTNTLVYLRGGVSRNKADVTSSTIAVGIDNVLPPPTATSPLSQTISESVTGWRGGIGLEQYLGHCFAVNIDYVYTYYSGISLNGVANSHGFDSGGSAVTVTNGLTNKTSAQLSTQAITLGLTWHFANPWR